jgi:hypothetical protein
MDRDLIIQILKTEGLDLASQTFVNGLSAYLTKNKTATDAQLVSAEDGSFKHYIRTKIGFFVDIFWGEAEAYVDEAIAAAIPAARTLAGVPEPVA